MEKKIFKVSLYMLYAIPAHRGTAAMFLSLYMLYMLFPPTVARRPCFLSDHFFFKESKRGLPKEHSYKIIIKSIEALWRRFFSFTICYIVKISPAHGGHVFSRIFFFSRNLKEVYQKNIHTKLQKNPLRHYGEEDFLKFHY